MEFLVNDLSLNGQFPDLDTFRGAISRMMAMREIAHQFGRELHCHRNVAHAQVTQGISMQHAIQTFSRDQRLSVIQWLTKHGPFWEDSRCHSSDDYLECDGEIVTDTAVGEAAWNCINGRDQRLTSFTPSDWQYSPVVVHFEANTADRISVNVENYWDPNTFQLIIRSAPQPIESWNQLARTLNTRCPNLMFSSDSFNHLLGHPFSIGAAYRIIELLDTLDRFRCCFDERGQRTSEGQRIYQNHFTGDKSWFSDSSETEKNNFREQLTFRHPTIDGGSLFCSWHGKVKIQQLRIHFAWPVRSDEPLFIVYVGPKITKH